ncbi:MAG: biotin--[acetyl-CoA-carboxylase] ligase [Deltaproteobacteria bacterium]|nr:biotin--[acetyl-CoA-carboxylase] ligase [Deltaproteobacteria bacterium]
MTLVTAVAVQQGLEQLKLNTLVKWPNDLLLEDGRKLAGILTESQSQSGDVKAIVIGIGLNIQRLADAPPEYGFLSDIGYLGSRSEVLEAILETLEFHIDHLNTPGHFGFCLNYLRKHSATIGRPVTNGIAVDINSDGSLLVQDSQGKLSSMYT